MVRSFEPTLAEGSAAVVFASSAAHSVPGDPAIDALLDEPSSPTLLDDLAAAGLADHPGLAYAVSKRGVIRLVQRHARTWGRAGARLVSLSPGIIDTPMGRLESASQPMMAEMVAGSALPREGRPEEIAARSRSSSPTQRRSSPAPTCSSTAAPSPAAASSESRLTRWGIR